jgi:plastocyanin
MRVGRIASIAIVVACLSAARALAGDNFIVEEKDKTFVYQGAKVDVLQVKVGDVVQFKNLDQYFHNVFSLSDPKTFDLGSFGQGQSRSVTFDKAGRVEVEGAMHPSMHMVVDVK